jgi:outer membrane immunogenic protein
MQFKAPTYAPPSSDWSGFYLGLNGGYAVGNDPFNQSITVTEPTVPPTTITESSSINSHVTPQGGLFGGQLGYNYQTGHWVLGLEGDIQWADQKDTSGCGFLCISEPGFGTITEGSAEQKINWFATARGRIGWATPGWLLYVTGGGAWAGIDATTAISETGVLSLSNTTSFIKSGWVVGGGAEVRIAGPWTAKVEYLYMDLGGISDTLAVPAALGAGSITTNSWIHDNIIRAGFNYNFNWGGQQASRY